MSTLCVMLDVAKLKQARERKGMSQAAAAAKAGVSRQRWNDIESGRKVNIELDTLGAIAACVGIDPAELIRRADLAKVPKVRKPGPKAGPGPRKTN